MPVVPVKGGHLVVRGMGPTALPARHDEEFPVARGTVRRSSPPHRYRRSYFPRVVGDVIAFRFRYHVLRGATVPTTGHAHPIPTVDECGTGMIARDDGIGQWVPRIRCYVVPVQPRKGMRVLEVSTVVPVRYVYGMSDGIVHGRRGGASTVHRHPRPVGPRIGLGVVHEQFRDQILPREFARPGRHDVYVVVLPDGQARHVM